METRSEGVGQNDQPASTKRKRSPSNEEQRPSKRSQDPERGIRSFKEMQYPSQRMHCIISINEEKPLVSLYPANDGFAILLFMNSGRYGPPLVALNFRHTGFKQHGRIGNESHHRRLCRTRFERSLFLSDDDAKAASVYGHREQQKPYHASANTDRPKSKQAEQSTAEPGLNPASQSAENSTVMRAQDAKMSDPSISVLPKTHPIPEMRAMLTFGAGPLSPPTQDLRTSVSGFSFGFDILTSVPACISAWPSTFAPTFMGADIDNNSKSESDSGTESKGDMERQHDGQGMVDCRTA
ncbi:MAG: hypothetical protein Q9161_005762 [Pseudevernia consocians]